MAGPLNGFRVLDLTTVLMGPYTTRILGDLGADVIKIESHAGDDLRNLMPGRNPGMGPMFLALNGSKRSVSVDLKKKEGTEVVLRLVEHADVFISNMRPAALARLGLQPERLHSVNRRLVVLSLVGFGSNGPYAGRPAYDDLIQAAVGLPWLYERAGGESPRYVPLAFADRFVGAYAASTVTAALLHRERSGLGQLIELPMFETMAQLVLGDHLAGRTFEPPLYGSGYSRLLSLARRPYLARDGYIAVVPYNDRQWINFFEVAGLKDVVGNDPRFANMKSRTEHIDALYGLLAEAIKERTVVEWLEALSGADIPAMQVRSLDDLIDDEHLRATGFFQFVDHPSEGLIRVMGVPGRWSGTPQESSLMAPRLGEHSREVLIEAGFPEDEIQRLLASGVLFQDPATRPAS